MPRGADALAAGSIAGGAAAVVVVVLDLPLSGPGTVVLAGALGCSVRVVEVVDDGVADGRVDGGVAPRDVDVELAAPVGLAVGAAVAGWAAAEAVGHRAP